MFEYFSDVRKVETLAEADISFLIDNQVPENKQLDYKLKLTLDDDKDKIEFLKDISSFSNSQGGVIIYGLQEVKVDGANAGIPTLPVIPGLQIKNLDKTRLAVLSCLRTGTNPPVNTVYFSSLLNVSGHQVLALGIPKNSSLPAMVTKNDINTFFRRNQTQKYPMDTIELYNAFLRHSTERREVEAFVQQRLFQPQYFSSASAKPFAKVYDPYFKSSASAPKVIIHLLHTDYLQNVSLETFSAPDFRAFAQDHFHSTANDLVHEHAYGFEGLYMLSRKRGAGMENYSDGTLLFRNGILESLTTTVFSEWSSNSNYSCVLYGEELLQSLVHNIKGAFAYYERARISPGFYLSLVIHTPGNITLSGPGNSNAGKVQKRELKFPVFLVTRPSEVANVLGLILDMLFQSAGAEQCPEELKEIVKGYF